VNCYPFIEAEKAGRRNVSRACALLKVSRAAFYQYLAGPSRRERDDAGLAGQIEAIHEESKGRYGAPRVQAELRRRGRRHGRKRVARLMRRAGIRGRAPKRWRKTTIADPAAAARADAIRRDFTTDAGKINSRWCGDITYIGTWEGWLYLATVIDIASRRVVGYALADHLRTELVSAALGNALAARDPAPGVIFHSDRGCQGGFTRSSQHLDHGGVRWDAVGSNCRTRQRVHVGSGRRIGRCGRRCGHRAGLSPRVRCSGSSGG
jgi:HTH-like domain/Integrase core domain